MIMSFSSFLFTQTDRVMTTVVEAETRSSDVSSLQHARRPRMLKDFLEENANSCSSTGFVSFPRKLIDPSLENMLNINASCREKCFSKIQRRRPTLLRCLTSTAKMATPKALAFRAVVAAVKNVSFPSVKARTLLPRSLSRRLSRRRWKGDGERENDGDFTVKVKDIIRWKSFCDLLDEKFPPLDFAASPNHYTAAAATATTTTTTTTTTSSNSSSWCESDFTAEDLPLPSWRGYSDGGGEGEIGTKYFPCVGRDHYSTEATTGTAKRAEDDKKKEASSGCDEEEEGEEEQHSPVSVLDYPFEHEDEEEEEELEEVARRLSDDVKAAVFFSGSFENGEHHLDRLLLDFFREELSYEEGKRVRNSEKMRKAEAWMRGGCLEWGLLQNRKEAYVAEMEREGRWKLFGDEEKQGLGLEIEFGILGSLVDEILVDIIQF